MANGYYTDKAGHVLGYWDLDTKPENTDTHDFIESAERPELYVSPEEQVSREIASLKYLLDSEDWIVTRQTEQNTLSLEEWEAFKSKRQGYRDRIDQLKQGV